MKFSLHVSSSFASWCMGFCFRAFLGGFLCLPFSPLQAQESVGRIVCLEGSQRVHVGNEGGQACVNETSLWGPFTKGMLAACNDKGGGSGCTDEVWEKGFGLWIRGNGVCPLGAWFDRETRYCAEGDDALGPFPESLRASCVSFGGGLACAKARWSRDFLLGIQDHADLDASRVDAIIDDVRKRGVLFRKPTDQDLEGVGIYPAKGEVDYRSEQIYPPFVLGPRRQTDSLVRQAYLLLPAHVQSQVAFVIPDRLLQNPEAYLPYLRSRARVVVIASFVGVGRADSRESVSFRAAQDRHALELWQLKRTLALMKALRKPVSGLVLGMGDSPSALGSAARARLQERLRRIAQAAGVASVTGPLTWGADELVSIAFARQLPKLKVAVNFANPHARHIYDGLRTSVEVFDEKRAQIGLEEVEVGSDFQVAVLGRRPDTETEKAFSFDAADAAQDSLDQAFLERFGNLSPARLSTLVLIDARLPNGAWNAVGTLRQCSQLAFGSWGTFANNVGQTLALAKILFHAKNPAANRQLLLEAYANDIFANGHSEIQSGLLKKLLEPLGIPFSHFHGYPSAQATGRVFSVLHKRVNQRMWEHFRDNSCMTERYVRVSAQLWRTFESEVHLWPKRAGEVFVPGVFRTDLKPAEVFNPTDGHGERLDLARLVAQGCCH